MLNRNIYSFISHPNSDNCQLLENGRAHFGQPGIQIGLVAQDGGAVFRDTARRRAFFA